MKKLRIAGDRRRIVTEDGGRFYLTGDTAWELFHALSAEEAELYLRGECLCPCGSGEDLSGAL